MMLKFCNEKPSATLKMSLGEIHLCLDEGFELFKGDMQRHVDIKCAILNAPWVQKRGKKVWEWADFLPKEMLPPKPKKPVTTEAEKSRNWFVAAEAMMAVVEEHERENGKG